MCVFLYSAKGSLPLMCTNGSIANFTLSLAKLSSVTGIVLHSVFSKTTIIFFYRYLSRLCTEIQENTQIFTDTFLIQDPYPYRKKMGLIIKKFLIYIQNRLLHNNAGDLNIDTYNAQCICGCQYALPNCTTHGLSSTQKS